MWICLSVRPSIHLLACLPSRLSQLQSSVIHCRLDIDWLALYIQVLIFFHMVLLVDNWLQYLLLSVYMVSGSIHYVDWPCGLWYGLVLDYSMYVCSCFVSGSLSECGGDENVPSKVLEADLIGLAERLMWEITLNILVRWKKSLKKYQKNEINISLQGERI